MQEQVNVRPMVDILSKETGKTVVMSGDAYVYLDSKIGVEKGIVDSATIQQQSEIVDAQRGLMNEAIQNMLDEKAREYRYDNMMSVRSYAGYTNPFQAEAEAMAVWASNCWVKAGEIEADVLAGNRSMPTVDEVLLEMPVYQR